jgi:hypothetical protein
LGCMAERSSASSESLWAKSDSPPLIDVVRDRLRGRIDPLPAFEAKAFDEHPGGPAGVIRVYESSDTPHIALENGAVYVRAVAGVRDAANPKRSGVGAVSDRHYEAVKMGSLYRQPLPYKQEVTGSSPVPPTREGAANGPATSASALEPTLSEVAAVLVRHECDTDCDGRAPFGRKTGAVKPLPAAAVHDFRERPTVGKDGCGQAATSGRCARLPRTADGWAA